MIGVIQFLQKQLQKRETEMREERGRVKGHKDGKEGKRGEGRKRCKGMEGMEEGERENGGREGGERGRREARQAGSKIRERIDLFVSSLSNGMKHGRIKNSLGGIDGVAIEYASINEGVAAGTYMH